MPIIRESYQYLISYYEKKSDFKKQLNYINKLIELDSLLYSNEIYLNKNIIKKYDLPKLVSEKKLLTKKLNRKEKIFRIIIIILFFIIMTIALILSHQNKKHKLYKKRFEEIINNKKIINPINESNIPKEIERNILNEIFNFEQQQEFLSKTITLGSLATRLKTNTSYLSKIINEHKKTSFTNYINNLKISYIIEELKTNINLQKFTIKAISDEAGFNNSESFSKAFYKIKGIKPSYFLRELEKYNKNN